MRIAVCIKQVREVSRYLEFTPDGRQVDAAFVTTSVNEADLCAVEAALRLREAAGGEVVLLSVGEDDAEEALRAGLAMGPERAVRVWAEGIAVTDAHGAPLGRSRAAGRAAVAETIATRTLYLAPMLWMPPLHGALVARSPLLRASPGAALAAYVLHAAATSALVTPACIALFEQRASRGVADVEPEFAGRVDARGVPITRVFYNKGL